MVVSETEPVVRGFVVRLRQALDLAHPTKRGQAGWLARQLTVSTTAVQKYMEGQAMPKGARWQKLADVLKVNVAWLRDGEGPMGGGPDLLLVKFQSVWNALSDDSARAEILEFARFKLSAKKTDAEEAA